MKNNIISIPEANVCKGEEWGQPPASNYVLTVDGGIMYGSIVAMLTSSSPSPAHINSPVYVTNTPAEDTPSISDTDFASMVEIEAIGARLLNKNDELYQRLA